MENFLRLYQDESFTFSPASLRQSRGGFGVCCAFRNIPSLRFGICARISEGIIVVFGLYRRGGPRCYSWSGSLSWLRVLAYLDCIGSAYLG